MIRCLSRGAAAAAVFALLGATVAVVVSDLLIGNGSEAESTLEDDKAEMNSSLLEPQLICDTRGSSIRLGLSWDLF